MMPTIFVIGTMTIFSVSLAKVKEATVKIKQVNIVLANYRDASSVEVVYMLNLAKATSSSHP